MVMDEARRVQVEIYRRMTPEQRLAVALSLYRSAREFKAACLRQFHPDWTEKQVQEAVKEAFLYARG